MMKTKTSQQNKFLRIIKTPVRALGKARDFYVKSMTNYAGRMNSGDFVAVSGTTQISGLPKSFSVNSARLFHEEDLRELVRAVSARSNDSYSYSMQDQTTVTAGGPRAMPPRSTSTAMGRIDEDSPCCYFVEDITSNINDIVSVKNEFSYPRSKSHVVVRRTVF